MRVVCSSLLMVLVLVSQVAYAQVTTPTTLSVVLVTFEDDVPHGYTRTGTALTPTVGISYTLNDFERKFGASGTFKHEAGITLSGLNPDREELPAAYGSVKDYFEEMSGGELDFDVRIVNREDPNDSRYPEWIVLNGMEQARTDYEEDDVNDSSFLIDALIAARRYRNAAYTTDEIASDFADFPSSIYVRTTDVVVFVYSGWQSGNGNGLHPHAYPSGSCYVTGERQGGHLRPGPADRFTGIGIHVHEMGHVLGLRHPQSDPGRADYVTTDDYNPYADQTPGSDTYERPNSDGTTSTVTVANWAGGSIAGWCAMHQGSDGPATEGSHSGDGAFMYSWASCPNLYNPFYIKDLRDAFMWTTTSTAIHERHRTQQHVRIDPAPEHYYLIDAPGGELMLEFRDGDSFGKYNQWYQFDEAPGLLVWRRNRVNLLDPGEAPLPRIIPADNRRIFNALAQPVSGETTRLWNDSFVYPWIDIISDPFGAVQEVSTGENLVEANGLRSTIESMASYQGEDPAALPDYMQLVGPAPGRNWPAHRVTPDWATDESHFARPPSRTDANGNEVGDDDPLHVALRNIVVNRGTDPHALVNIFHGYWEGTLTQSASWSGDVYVGGDLIVPDGITLTIGNGTTVHFLKPRESDVNSNEIAEIVVRDRGTLDIGTDVTFTSAHERKNESDEADDQENEDHGLIAEDGGIVTIEGLTFYDGTHTLSGEVTVGGDLIVGDGTNAATLRLEAGTEVRFASTDAESDGQDRARTELIVQGTLTATGPGITFRSINEDPSSLEWYGIRVESGGAATLTDVTVQDGVHCAKAESGGTLNRTRVALSNCGTSPQVEGDRAVAYAEQGEGTEPTDRLVATYRATDAEDDEVSWALAGPDMQRLILSVGGELRFPDASPPDFEAPAGSQGNTYRVTVRAEDSQQATTEYPVTVTVTNVDEPGSVVLSTGTPQVDQEVTATLRDPDGGLVVRAEDWQWQGRAPGSTTWVTLSGSTAGRSVPPSPEAPERSSYTPASEHAGWLLRAVVNHYEDGHGPGKRAHSEATEPVQDVPGPPRKLKATPGDRQVTLRWSAPASDGGSQITGYSYQDSAAGGDWSDWALIEGSDASTRRHTVRGLTNDTEYTFAVRAVNAVGAGASVRVPATPRRPDTPGRVEVGPTQPRVGETLKATLVDPDTPVEVTGWRWRRLASWDRSADIDSASAPPSSERWTQVVGRTRKYKPVKADLGRRLRVEVDYTDRSGAQGARTTTPAVQAGPPCAPPDLAAAAGAEDGQVELTWGAACNHGSAIRQYQYQHLGASAWEPVSGDGSARRQVVDGLTAGQTYPFQVRARNGVGPGPPSQVTVALPDPDPPDDPPPPRPGTITLEPSIAQTCARLTATLRDPDGGIDLEPSHSPTTEPTFTYGWVWDPRSFPSDGPASAATSVTQDYTPPNSSVGRFIEVTARYGDNRSDRNEVLVRSGTVVANTPRTPGRLAGAAGDGQVDLSWTAPDDCGSDITHYDYRVRPNPSGAWSAWQDTTATSVTVSPLTNDVEYTFEVRAHNARGASRVAAITRRPLSNATLTLTADDPPYVLTAMIANFSHPGAGTVTGWAWYRLTRADQEESSDNHITGQITNRYVPREADLNHWIRVIATYNDHHAQGRTVAATTAQAVQRGDPPGTITFTGIDPPLVNREITATLHDDDNPTNLAWQWDVVGAAGARPEGRIDEGNTYTPGSGHVGSRIRAQVIYDDDFGTGKIVRNTTPVVQASSTLTLREISKQDVRENTQRLAGVYESIDPQGRPVAWSLIGTDPTSFQLRDVSGHANRKELRFKTAPNYEGQSSYSVTVRVSAAGVTKTKTVPVTVLDGPDTGTITLAPTTTQTCARIVATLRDEDSGLHFNQSLAPAGFTYGWLWDPRYFPSDGGQAASVTTQDYTPPNSSVGQWIEVTVRYGDDQGDREEVLERSSSRVLANTPRTPGRLAGAAGDGQVDLSWTAPDDCGSDITHYDYRVRPNPSGAWSAWQDTTATSVTVSPLTNDVEYTFEVRAHNARGASRVAAITRRPLSNAPDPDATLTLTADDPPYVRTAMIANFSHPGAGTVTGWAWYRLTRADQEESSDNHITGQITNRYVPREADLNHWIRVIATYNDHHAQGRTVAATTAQAVQRGDDGGTITFTGIDPPLVNREISATLHDDDNPTNLAWQWDVAGAAGARPEGRIDEGNTYTPGSGHVGSRIRAQVIYDDDFGRNKIVRNTTPGVQASSTLTLREISKRDVRENTQRLAGVYESIDPQGRPVAWSLIGTDPTSFQLRDVSGHANRKELRFKTAPNYEGQSSYSVTVRVSAAGVTKTKTVPVTVLDGPDTGTITLAPTTTQTCARIVATLRDEDSGLHFNQSLAPAGFTYGWLWDPRYFPSDGGQAASVTTQDYIPPNSSVGQWIEVTVRYGDDQGDREEVLQRSSSRVLANTPRVPSLSGTAGVGQVALSWTKPGDCGSTLTGYDYKYKPVGGQWSALTPTTTRAETITGLTGGVDYLFEVRAHNARGASRVAAITRRPLSNRPPTVTCTSPVTVDERISGAGPTLAGPCTGTDPDGDRLTWSAGSGFRVSPTSGPSGGSTTVSFTTEPDYETAQSHTVAVTATDPHGASGSDTITINVRNVDEPGTLTISPDPARVRERVTLTVTDPDDGVRGTNWAWWPVSSASRTTGDDARNSVSAEFYPNRTYANKKISARVTYTDNHGSGKDAEKTTTHAVRPNVPLAPPDLTAARGDGQVSLSWGDADDGGATIDRYNYRYRVQGGSYPGYSRVYGLSKTLTGLTNGTTYDLQVRAHNSEGFGSPSTVSAMPAGRPDAPSGFGHGRQSAGQVRVEWDAPADNGSPITAYYWSRRVGSFWNNETSTGTSTYFHDLASNSVAHTYRVRAMNAVGFGGYGEYTVPAEERSPRSKALAAFADSTGFGILTAPNPFNSRTLIHMALPEDAEVTLSIHSVTGQTVARLHQNHPLEAGLHTLEWRAVDDRGRPVGSGIYLFRVIAGDRVHVGKLALIR